MLVLSLLCVRLEQESTSKADKDQKGCGPGSEFPYSYAHM